jgi:hypothetical protein
MKARLEEIEELAGNVVVYRHYDVESQLQTRMAKSAGKCVIIRLISAKNESKAKASQFVGTITVTLFTLPLLTQSDLKNADTLVAEIEAKLNDWWPATLPSNRVMSMKSGDITFPDDPEFDVTSIIFRTPPVPLLDAGEEFDSWEQLYGSWENL